MDGHDPLIFFKYRNTKSARTQNEKNASKLII